MDDKCDHKSTRTITYIAIIDGKKFLITAVICNYCGRTISETKEEK